MKRYVDILKKLGIENYLITGKKRESAELFFIKKNLDMRRMKNVTDVTIRVFKDMQEGEKKFRGHAIVVGSESMTDEEWEERLKSAVFSASNVKNPFFGLPQGVKSEEVVVESGLNKLSLTEAAERFAKTAYEADNDPDAFINSFEVFSTKTQVRIVASNGCDVSYVKRNVWGELIAQCKAPQDVESYKQFSYDDCDFDEMKEFVTRTLQITKDRAKASKMPKAGTYDIILSDEHMSELMVFYKDRANAAYIFPGYSTYKVGDNIQGDVKGDLLNAEFDARVPFSDSGIPMSKRPFIEEGVLKTIHGDVNFTYYLGVEQIGNYDKVVLPKGKVKFSELVNRRCLHVVNFSAFDMDSLDGTFKGEIRLAYLYDGNKNVSLVTGGSINGSIFEAQKDMIFSEELTKQEEYEGPKAVLLKNVAVAGA